ncbi:MAG: hypothetical protein ACE5KS_01785 [Woeseiaceae bacterium]
MKYLISLLVGMAIGIALFVLVLYYNPFVGNPSVSPLAVSELDLVDLSYSLVPSESIVYTNDGESHVMPHPAKVLQLWEPTVKQTRGLVTILTDSRGQPAGLGVKFSSDSEQSELINARVLVDSVWHIYLAERGTFFVDQTENFWPYLHDIVVPARLSSGDNWRGTWHRVMSAGPGALGTARVTGSTGHLSGGEAEAVESVTARAYSAISGPVAMTGNLTIAFPHDEP